jgi:hypothetical protein
VDLQHRLLRHDDPDLGGRPHRSLVWQGNQPGPNLTEHDFLNFTYTYL